MRFGFSFLPILHFFKQWFKYIVILSIIFIIMIGGLWLYKNHLERSWQSVSIEKDRDLADEIKARFTEYQEKTVHVLQDVAARPEVQEDLSAQTESSRTALFEFLLSLKKRDLSIELLDSNKQPVAWAGNKGVQVDTSIVPGHLTSFVTQGPINSYLVVIVPLKNASTQRWYVVGKRLFDVNYPINNNFINNDAFSSTFTSKISFDLDFDFTPAAKPSNDSNIISVPLTSIDGKALGFTYLPRPTLESSQEEIQHYITKTVAFFLLLLVVVLAYGIVVFTGSISARVARVIIFTLAIWLLRYMMVWANLPQAIFNISLFDPKTFASPFGFGIAKSIGDMLISASILLWNMVVVASNVAESVSGNPRRYSEPSLLQKIFMMVLFLGIPLLLCLCLRGVSSTIHSAVFDSSLAYNDPTFVLPPFPLAVMLINLFVVSSAFVLGAIVLLLGAYNYASMLVTYQRSSLFIWGIIGLLCLVTSILFGLLQPHPLTGQFARAGILAGLLLLSIIVTPRRDEQFRLNNTGWLWVIASCAVLLLVSLLDHKVHEIDRTHVELLSTEIMKPSDQWLTVVVNQALDQLSNDDAATVLSSREEESLRKLAFTQWAKSILSTEGSNCSVVFMDKHGQVVSDFHIGLTPHLSSEIVMEISPTKRYVDVENYQANNGTRWHRGYTPVVARNGDLLGGVWVELSAGKQTAARNESQEVLKNYTKEQFQTHFRALDISEYVKGKLVSTSNENMPHNRELPGELTGSKSEENGRWIEESIEGLSYETYYLRNRMDGTNESWTALSLHSLDIRWHVYSYLRYVLFYIFIFAIVVTIIWGSGRMRKAEIVFTFRAKLMTAFIIVSFIPIIILAYYNRQYAMERTEEMLLKRLSDQTAVVGAELQRQFGINAPYGLSKISDEQCVAVADELDADFNVYKGDSLQASSKPEMVIAELLDSRISARAFVNVMLKGKNFFSENQSIGKLPYVVGYRPVVSDNGSIIGMVSIPTLFRQNEVDEELTRRNVFLFGAYALALLLSLVAGTIFVNQIASPITRLKNATRQIATGNLDMRFHSGRKDEIGELERAFDEMAHDLRESQKQMAKSQRDIAWREMAKQVAHEIKNPLTPVKLSIQHLRQAYTDGVKDFGSILHQVSNTILEQIDALSRIASEFSQYARMPERKIERCSVHAILGETAELFKQQGDITIVTSLTAPLDIVNGDRDELRRAFINIVRNAIQAMNERGTIHIATALSTGTIEIRFHDQGPGMTSEVREHLFEPNFSTKTEGMGLGLSIVKKTADDMNGTITVNSAIDQGTTVTLCFPLAT
jgi:signal transduction histidine kinase